MITFNQRKNTFSSYCWSIDKRISRDIRDFNQASLSKIWSRCKNGKPNQWRCNFDRMVSTDHRFSLRRHNAATFLNEAGWSFQGHFVLFAWKEQKRAPHWNAGCRPRRKRERKREIGHSVQPDTLYFGLILLKADRISRFHSSRGQCACVPFSISLPFYFSHFLSSAPSLHPKFVFTRRATNPT